MNQKLGSTAREEIRKAMHGLTGPTAKAEAVRLAADHGVSWQYVYGMTSEQRKGKRKPRSDAGRRTYALVPDSDVWYAAQLVVAPPHLDPDQALLTAKLRGHTQLPTLETFRKLLHENGLGKTQRRTGRRGHRRWEAEAPGQIFQIDVTALKTRWEDVNTRRVHQIEGVDKNHPQMETAKLRVWQIMLVDDHSRRRFLRYVATTAITSTAMVRFECEAFQRLGVPHVLYTDNGSEFKGQHLVAEKILNTLLANEGGYRHERHTPGNPQATGKVEGAHKWAEKADRLIGLAVSEGRKLDIDDLNRFADEICEHYDYRVHRATGEKPINRWHGKRVVVRKVSPEVIESALLSDQFPAVIEATLTVTHRKVTYRLPNDQIFADRIGQTVQIVVPPHIDMILLTMPNGEQYEIDKVLATVDVAGEYRSVVESRGETLTKQLKASRKQAIAAIKEQTKLTGQIAPVPHLDVPFEVDKAGIINFPQRETVVTAEEVNEVIPVVGTQAASLQSEVERREIAYVGKPISYWQAVAEYSDRFAGKDEAKQFLLGLFPDREGEVTVTEIEACIDGRNNQRKEGLRLAG